MSTLTLEEAVAHLDEIVAGVDDDFVYRPIGDCDDGSQCVYVIDGQPSCIVGHLAARIAPDEYTELTDVSRMAADALHNYLGFDCAPDVASVLNKVQVLQDSGIEWKWIMRVYHHSGIAGLFSLADYISDPTYHV